MEATEKSEQPDAEVIIEIDESKLVNETTKLVAAWTEYFAAVTGRPEEGEFSQRGTLDDAENTFRGKLFEISTFLFDRTKRLLGGDPEPEKSGSMKPSRRKH